VNLCLTFTGIQHDMSHILDMRKNTSKTIKIKKRLLTIYQFMWGMQILSMLHTVAEPPWGHVTPLKIKKKLQVWLFKYSGKNKCNPLI